MTETAVVVQKHMSGTLWILPKVEKFPKPFRFSLGQNLAGTSLDLLMLNLSGYEFAFGGTRARRARCQAHRPKTQRVAILFGDAQPCPLRSYCSMKTAEWRGGRWKSVRKKDEAGA